MIEVIITRVRRLLRTAPLTSPMCTPRLLPSFLMSLQRRFPLLLLQRTCSLSSRAFYFDPCAMRSLLSLIRFVHSLLLSCSAAPIFSPSPPPSSEFALPRGDAWGPPLTRGGAPSAAPSAAPKGGPPPPFPAPFMAYAAAVGVGGAYRTLPSSRSPWHTDRPSLPPQQWPCPPSFQLPRLRAPIPALQCGAR